jgi:hypothetical protein
MAVAVGRKSGDSGGLRRLSMDKMQGGRRRRSRVCGFSEGEMTWRRKSSEGGGSCSALMTDGERKRKGGVSLAWCHAEGRRWGAWYGAHSSWRGPVTPARARRCQAASVHGESSGGGTMAVSCWAGCHGHEMNNDNFDFIQTISN